jgi:hypothetical protein
MFVAEWLADVRKEGLREMSKTYESIIGSGLEQAVVITIFRQGQLLRLSIQTSD